MRLIFLSIIAGLVSVHVFCQSDSSNTQNTDTSTFRPPTVVQKDNGVYPYMLPIWGQKAQDRGFGDRLQLPFGLNVMYVNTSMDVEITDFALEIGDNDELNEILAQVATIENLNFTETTATANGLNFRGDVWVLPFLNVYGMYSAVTGGTGVKLQPTFYLDSTGSVVDPGSPGINDTIALPEFGSEVEFTAQSTGLGGTFAYGYKSIFVSLDGNYTWNRSALLNQTLGMFTGSGRIGKVFKFKKKDRRLAFYIGFMYRDFADTDPSSGQITFGDALPDLQETIDAGLAGMIPACFSGM